MLVYSNCVFYFTANNSDFVTKQIFTGVLSFTDNCFPFLPLLLLF